MLTKNKFIYTGYRYFLLNLSFLFIHVYFINSIICILHQLYVNVLSGQGFCAGVCEKKDAGDMQKCEPIGWPVRSIRGAACVTMTTGSLVLFREESMRTDEVITCCTGSRERQRERETACVV